MGTGGADDQVVTIEQRFDGGRTAGRAHDEAGPLFACLAGRDQTQRCYRDRRLRRHVRRALGEAADIEVVFAVSTTRRRRRLRIATIDQAGRRRDAWSFEQVAVVVDCRGAVTICSRSPWSRAVVVRHIGDGEIGAISVAPGNSYIDLGGARWRVTDPWMYELFRLQQQRMAAERSRRPAGDRAAAGHAAATRAHGIGA